MDKAFTCTAGLSTNEAHEMTVQLEEKNAAIFCWRLWLILETVIFDTLVASICISISSWAENWGLLSCVCSSAVSLSGDRLICSTAGWQIFLWSRSLSCTRFRDILASAGAARHVCALLWLIGRSLTHLSTAETAYKRDLPPMSDYYTATLCQFGWSLYRVLLLL